MHLTFTEDNGHVSEIIYIKNFFSKDEANLYLKHLFDINDLKHGTTPFGNVPRLQKWYHDDMQPFCRFWKNELPRWNSHTYEPWLVQLKERINKQCNMDFNSCLLNFYRNGNDSIRPHSDDKRLFGETPTIFALSFGDTRTMQFVPTIPGTNKILKCGSRKPFKIQLEHGSLLIMKGWTQRYFLHEVLKDNEKDLSGRFSVTFRKHLI